MHKGSLWQFISYKKHSNSPILLFLVLLLWCSFTMEKHQKSNIKNYTIETSDHVIVVKNNTVVFEYLEQAAIKEPVQLRVIEMPKFGEVTLNVDNTFEYAPAPNLCEQEDQFTYLMTAGKTSLKVVVSIEILCESLTFFSGIVKEEKDQQLNNFKILGVENFPKNALHIFNNEGREVYAVNSYKNDWNGTIDGAQNLAKENLYYYVFNDGEGNYYAGYLTKFEKVEP